jgi:hypothetical protein
MEKNTIQPRHSRYWRNAETDPRKDERIAVICEVYQQSASKEEKIAFSTDEMTRIPALERIAADLPMLRRNLFPRAFECKSHST